MAKDKILKVSSYMIAPIIFLILAFAPLDLLLNQKIFLAIFSFVISLWLFTDLPLFISGILGVCLSVIFGVVSLQDGFAPFSNPIIFLFLGGFLLAKALEITKLDEALAAATLNIPWARKSAKRTVFIFLLLSFVLSMWISNTAAVAMLLPLGIGLIKRLEVNFGIDDSGFKELLLISLAYSATIGGIVTPIGSPPNVIAIGLLNNLTGQNISFLGWMLITAPIAAILFSVVYYLCIKGLPTQKLNPVDTEVDMAIVDYRSFSVDQKHVIIVFLLTVFFWVSPSIVELFVEDGSTMSVMLRNNFSSAVVGLFFASTLFLFPLKSADKILNSKHISQIDWPSLLLFGSGLSLGQILFKTGLAQIMADSITNSSGDTNIYIVLSVLILFTIFFTELASNTASANILIPIMIAIGVKNELNTLLIALIFALSCNSAFMLPVATPPNAIVYGTNLIRKSALMQRGFSVNILSWFILSILLIFALN
ncbi:DASS family sodium-coupled anion symporter [Halobacteriovorax sp.]|uniref:SLC13 family permease n=1 Tax=Halobacteriovorax sp. TaxID=2020862 RepID=UPI0035638F3C